MKILDVGCGANKVAGSIGIDQLTLDNVDVIHDLDSFPWPFKNNEFDVIIFKHSIAHVDDVIKVMEEVHRIGKPGCIIEIITPHFSCDNYFTDPTHRHPMGYRSMNYVCDNIDCWKYTYSSATFDLLNAYISFGEYNADFNESESKSRVNIHRLLGFEYLVNRCKRIYEKFFCFIFPANTVYFKLKVKK